MPVGRRAVAAAPMVGINSMRLSHIPISQTHRVSSPRPLPWLALVFVPLVLIAGAFAWHVHGGGDSTTGRVATPSLSFAPAIAGRWLPTALTAEVDALLEEPSAPGHLLAGTSDGLWSSRDGGSTWLRAEGMPRSVRIFSLAAGKSSRLLFAGGNNGTLYALRPGRGASWRRISPNLAADPIFSLAVSPGDGRTLLAGTVGSLFRGVPVGAAWRWRRVATTHDSSVTAISWLSEEPRQVFASVFGSTPPVLRSDDNGLSWHADTRGLPATLPTEALLPLSGAVQRIVLSTMGGGVWLRSPSGAWQDISIGLPERHAMPMIAAGSRGPVFAGTMGGGIYRWQPGEPWERLGRGLIGAQYIVLSLAVTGGAHAALLAGTSVGVWRYASAL